MVKVRQESSDDIKSPLCFAFTSFKEPLFFSFSTFCVMDAPNLKPLCHVPSITPSSQNSTSFNQSDVDFIISSFLSLSNSPLFSSIGYSFDRALDKVITSAAGDEFDQDRFLDRILQLASLLHKSIKRCIRKRATLQNSVSWPLIPELTIKVFSMLDKKYLMRASASCTMFNKCAMDRVCYSHIDLSIAAKRVDDGVVRIMIQRAGKELRSLKLGCISPPARSTSLLTSCCFDPLFINNGFSGGCLRSLHLYNLEFIDCYPLFAVLSVCSNLTELKIFGFFSRGGINQVKLLAVVLRFCRFIERLLIEISSSVVLTGTDSTLVEYVDYCPNLTSLWLLRFGINDAIAQTILKDFRQLKRLDLSLTNEITGCFLRLSCRDSPLEAIILRHCFSLEEREVLLFLNSLLTGDFKSIRYIDVSSFHGLVSDDEGNRTFEPKFPIEELKKQRSGVTFVAIFVPLP